MKFTFGSLCITLHAHRDGYLNELLPCITVEAHSDRYPDVRAAFTVFGMISSIALYVGFLGFISGMYATCVLLGAAIIVLIGCSSSRDRAFLAMITGTLLVSLIMDGSVMLLLPGVMGAIATLALSMAVSASVGAIGWSVYLSVVALYMSKLADAKRGILYGPPPFPYSRTQRMN